MKALVTGGAGLIGSHVVDLLIQNGHQVRVLDNLEKPNHLHGKPDWLGPKGPLPRSPRHGTNIAGAMEFLLQSAKRKTVCFVVSDFFDQGFERAMRTANRKHDVIAAAKDRTP